MLTEANRLKDTQLVKNRIELRKNLKCRNFKWYLETVWPQHFMPMEGRFFGKVCFRTNPEVSSVLVDNNIDNAAYEKIIVDNLYV